MTLHAYRYYDLQEEEKKINFKVENVLFVYYYYYNIRYMNRIGFVFITFAYNIIKYALIILLL